MEKISLEFAVREVGEVEKSSWWKLRLSPATISEGLCVKLFPSRMACKFLIDNKTF